MGGKLRKMFFAPTVLEDWLYMVAIRFHWQLAVKVSTVIIRFFTERRICVSTWTSFWGSESGHCCGVPWWKCQYSWFCGKYVLSGLWSPLVVIHWQFSRRLGCLRPYVLLFCPSRSMHGCHCRRRWVRRCQSCQYQRLGVWEKWYIWRIRLWQYFLILKSLGQCGTAREISIRGGLHIGWWFSSHW